MEFSFKILHQMFPNFETEMLEEILEVGIIKNFAKDSEILRVGQFVKMLPVVLKGTVKVFTSYDEKEFLLYYILSTESCIMSLPACLDETPSAIFAVAEEDSEILLIPASSIKKWVKKYYGFNSLFYNLYNKRYSDMVNTLNQVLFENMEQRIYDYLLEKREIKNSSFLEIKHRQIAAELGTAREVVSRMLKKLEKDKKIK